MEGGKLKKLRPAKEFVLSEKRVTIEDINYEKEK